VSTLTRELDRAGLPTVLITALPTIARLVGANRILRGVAITNPTGDPTLSPQDELAARVRLVRRALEMLASRVEPGTVWQGEA
jgi:glycine reductase